MRGWSHFSGRGDESHVLSEDQVAELSGFYDGLEEVFGLLGDLRGDVAGFEFGPDLRRVLGEVEGLMGYVERVAGDVGVSVG